ncbi:hypothetical protein ABZ835_13780 [Streptomyces sp. NPDC047461]|uniref:hypothetical protein n=1 Tax=Streptomyces sp. NPDC047461 TaxID=3155619 RepID=UPI0034035A32
MRKFGRVCVPAVTAVVLAGATGCAFQEPCTGVGVRSWVGVYVVQDGYGGLAGASYELCTRGECVKGEFRREAVSGANLPLPNDVDPDTAPVRLRITRAGATTLLVDDSVDVKLLHRSDGCGGWSGTLALTEEDGLLTSVPKKVSAAWTRQLRSEAAAPPAPTSRIASGTPTG